METILVIVLVAVALAGAIFALKRMAKTEGGCGTSCGCGSAPAREVKPPSGCAGSCCGNGTEDSPDGK